MPNRMSRRQVTTVLSSLFKIKVISSKKIAHKKSDVSLNVQEHKIWHSTAFPPPFRWRIEHCSILNPKGAGQVKFSAIVHVMKCHFFCSVDFTHE